MAIGPARGRAGPKLFGLRNARNRPFGDPAGLPDAPAPTAIKRLRFLKHGRRLMSAISAPNARVLPCAAIASFPQPRSLSSERPLPSARARPRPFQRHPPNWPPSVRQPSPGRERRPSRGLWSAGGAVGALLGSTLPRPAPPPVIVEEPVERVVVERRPSRRIVEGEGGAPPQGGGECVTRRTRVYDPDSDEMIVRKERSCR